MVIVLDVQSRIDHSGVFVGSLSEVGFFVLRVFVLHPFTVSFSVCVVCCMKAPFTGESVHVDAWFSHKTAKFDLSVTSSAQSITRVSCLALQTLRPQQARKMQPATTGTDANGFTFGAGNSSSLASTFSPAAFSAAPANNALFSLSPAASAPISFAFASSAASASSGVGSRGDSGDSSANLLNFRLGGDSSAASNQT